MKKCGLLLLLILLPLIALPAQSGKESTLYHEIQARLLVKDRRIAGDEISSWCETLGGYYTVKSQDHLSLRLPADKLEELTTVLEAESSEILDYSRNAFDLKEELMMSASALEAREELLERNLEYLDRSDLEGTLTLEQEIRRLMTEIDRLKGRLRYLNNNIRYARVELALSFKNQSIPEGRPSRFDWINSIDFDSFLNSYPYDAGRGKKGPALDLPEGFALASERPWFQALSPEGVKIRLRTEKNYPEQSLDFWSKALFGHMEGLGYIPLSDAEDFSFSTDNSEENGDFKIRSWGVPYGREDYIYMTGIRINGSKIEILEICGLTEHMENYFPR